MNPSHVFLGERAKNGALMNLRPIVSPQKYAATSFITTTDTGKKNQKIPSNMLFMMNLHWPTIMHRVTIVHIIWFSWNLTNPERRVSTVATKRVEYMAKVMYEWYCVI